MYERTVLRALCIAAYRIGAFYDTLHAFYARISWFSTKTIVERRTPIKIGINENRFRVLADKYGHLLRSCFSSLSHPIQSYYEYCGNSPCGIRNTCEFIPSICSFVFSDCHNGPIFLALHRMKCHQIPVLFIASHTLLACTSIGPIATNERVK